MKPQYPQPEHEEYVLPDSVTPDQCRTYQASCRKEILAAVDEVKEMLVPVVAEMNYQRGLRNGTSANRREEDQKGWVERNKWLVIAILLAFALAGERIVSFLSPAVQSQSLPRPAIEK